MSNIPDEIKKQIEEEVEQAIKRGGQEYAGYYREGMEDGYSLAEKEIERLKGLIEFHVKSMYDGVEDIHDFWCQFKSENNL